MGPDNNEIYQLLHANNDDSPDPNPVDVVQILLDTIHRFGIRECKRVSCMDKKSRMHSTAPRIRVGSPWNYFRDWVLVAASCKAAFTPDGELKQGEETFACVGDEEDDNGDGIRCSNGFPHSHAAVSFCTLFLEDLGKYTAWLQRDGVDAFGLCQLLVWISVSNGRGRRSSPKIRTILKGSQLSIPEVRSAISQLSSQSVCQSRLWKLAEATEWGLCALPSLLDALGRFDISGEHVSKHRACNPQTCLLSDINLRHEDRTVSHVYDSTMWRDCLFRRQAQRTGERQGIRSLGVDQPATFDSLGSSALDQDTKVYQNHRGCTVPRHLSRLV